MTIIHCADGGLARQRAGYPYEGRLRGLPEPAWAGRVWSCNGGLARKRAGYPYEGRLRGLPEPA